MKKDKLFINDYDRVFMVRFMWNIGQPIVIGTLQEVVKYALNTSNNGIKGFYEIEGDRLNKVSKRELREMLSFDNTLSVNLFKVY